MEEPGLPANPLELRRLLDDNRPASVLRQVRAWCLQAQVLVRYGSNACEPGGCA